MYCTRQVIDGMKAHGRGKIVNIASEAAINAQLKKWDYAAAKAEKLRPVRDAIPLQMIGEPEDIVNAVAFFATDQSRYITGQKLQLRAAGISTRLSGPLPPGIEPDVTHVADWNVARAACDALVSDALTQQWVDASHNARWCRAAARAGRSSRLDKSELRLIRRA